MIATAALLDKSRVEIKLGDYGVAPATALSDPSVLPRVQEYRRRSSARMVPLDKDDISQKVPAAEYHVSRKVDGEFTVLVYRGGEVFSINPGGTVRTGLAWQEEAARLLSAAGIKEAMVPGELYVTRDDRRPRVHDVTTVARQPQSVAEVKQLRFAVFDLISLDGDATQRPFAEIWKSIQKIFGKGKAVHPVEAKTPTDVAGIKKLFAEWVEGENAEGLVVRSDAAGMFKIKPRHTLDLAVIGFTESQGDRQGMLHDLLLAIMRPEGTLQVLSRVGGGFRDDERRSLLSDLKDMVVESEYAEVNADHVAYQMVQPQWVVEISCLDLISQTTRGGPVNRMVLDFHANGSQKYGVVTKLPLASVISPQFIRRREDKTVAPLDIRISQVTDVVEVPLVERDARQTTLPCSEILRREVFTKELKGQKMVRKFMLWKTNKETDSDEFPSYVVHYTDFSPNRKDPLNREIRVSNSREQIESLLSGLKAENIKAGWLAHAPAAGAAVPAVAEAPASAPPPPATKKGKKAAAKEEPAPARSPEPAEPSTSEPQMAPSERKKRTTKKKSG